LTSDAIFLTLDDKRRRFSFNYLRERKHTLSENACLLGLLGSQRPQSCLQALVRLDALGLQEGRAA
jgi:hypothetical protein